MLQDEKQEVICFIDWLGLSVRLADEPRAIAGYTWREYSATNVWAKRRVLYTNDGDRVLTLLSNPRSTGFLSSSAGLVEIENEWLYHGGGTEMILGDLIKCCNFEVLGISRLDLCADFVPTDHQRDVIEGLAENRYYVGGKRNGSGFWSTNTNEKLNEAWRGRKIPHCQSWGHKTSAIKWKLYYKTKELLDDGGGKFMMKPYIIDQWREYGFDISNVWRLEVSMKHLNDYGLYGQRIDLQTLKLKRGSIFLSMYNQRFTIRSADGHQDRSNDKVVTFLPLDGGVKGFERMPARTLADHHGRITLLRHLVASLEDEHIYLDDVSRRDVLEHIGKIIRRDNLDNYFRAMMGSWFDGWKEKIEAEAVSAFDQRRGHAIALPMKERDSTDAERRIDLSNKIGNLQMSPNTTFESYNDNGEVIPKSEGLQMEKSKPPRRTTQYLLPLDRPRLPQYVQGNLLP